MKSITFLRGLILYKLTLEVQRRVEESSLSRREIIRREDNIFERLINIEFRAGELYGKLSILFTHVPEISAFWKVLAEEEKFHMNTLLGIYKSLTEEQLFSTSEKQMFLRSSSELG